MQNIPTPPWGGVCVYCDIVLILHNNPVPLPAVSLEFLGWSFCIPEPPTGRQPEAPEKAPVTN